MTKRRSNAVRTKVKAVGRKPWGYDHTVDTKGSGWYIPDLEAFERLDSAIMQIRDGGHSVRKVASWLENETGRKLSATRLHKLAWTKEELEDRRKTRRRLLSPKQRKIEDLKNTEKQTRIKADQVKRRLNKALNTDKVEPEVLV